MAQEITETRAAALPAVTSWKDLAAPLKISLEKDMETGLTTLGQMPIITSSLKEAAAAIIPRTEKHLTPVLPLDALAHVKVLLGFYYKDPSTSAAEIAARAELWVECLAEFPEWAIRAGIKEWLAGDVKNRRPVPGQIVQLCNKQVSEYRMIIFRAKQILAAPLPPPKPQPPTEEEKRRVSEMVAATVKKLSVAPDPVWNNRQREKQQKQEAPSHE